MMITSGAAGHSSGSSGSSLLPRPSRATTLPSLTLPTWHDNGKSIIP